MFKRNDYIIISIICFFLGIFLISQYYSGKELARVSQPENNEVLALEVSKLTKNNADLRREVQDLTADLENYQNSSESRKKAYEQYLADTDRYDIINGAKASSGQGIEISILGSLSTPQLVDLINASKNIGAEIIEINGERIILNTDLSKFSGQDQYKIIVLGNSKLLKSAMERKGGIVEQIATKDIKISITESDNLSVGKVILPNFSYSRIVE